MDHVYPNPNAPHTAIAAGSWRAWCVALRPKTFWIATMPVVVTSALVMGERGALDTRIALLALLASLLLQAITNLQNDVGYATRRLATGNHVGLSRATCNGWLTTGQVRLAIALCVAACVGAGIPVVDRWGVPAALMGLSSMAAALAYMGGPRPIAFTALGELTVFVFFGLIAVIGSYYVQTGTVSSTAMLAGIGIGALAAAILAVNNHRDRDHDAATKRRTFAVTFGELRSRQLFTCLLALGFAVVPWTAWAAQSAWLALPLLVAPRAITLVRDFTRLPAGPAWNALFFRTVKLELAYGVLLAAGAVLSRL